MVPQFDKVAFSSKVGDISPVFETPFGYHFLTVTGQTPAKTVSLEEAKETIIRRIKDQGRSGRMDEYIKSLQNNAKLTYFLPPAPLAPKAPMPPPMPPPQSAQPPAPQPPQPAN
jgi:peptidyl-prolyl cis-trans isomerase C